MDRVSPSDALGPSLTQSQISDLALFDQPRHRADRLLNGHRRINPVLVIKIDDIDAEPFEARVACSGNIGGTAIDTVGAARPLGLAEFARDHDIVAPAL